MKNSRSLKLKTALIALAAIFGAITPKASAQKMYDLPPLCDSVEKATSTDNLRGIASRTVDPQVLLGFACLARAGDPVRKEISQLAIKAKPEYAPILAVLAIKMDGIDDNSVDDLIKNDPENALGYYLRANLLYKSGKEQQALAAFRKAASCGELRLYETTTTDALFKALDALGLKERDRLCALSWMASRSLNFGAMGLQPLKDALRELAPRTDLEKQEEVSELLLVLAGHLFVTNFDYRWYGQRALESAFHLKAVTGAARKSPKMNTYAAVVQALVSTSLGWPGIDDQSRRTEPLTLARFVPSRIHRAFAFTDPSQRNATNFNELRVNLPESDKPAFDKAMQNAIASATALIDVALSDPDGILGAWLKGLPTKPKYEDGPWVSRYTFVEKLMRDRPDIFRAAAANEQAMDALTTAGKGDPRRRNMRQMMEIGLGILTYSADHNETFPDNIDALFEKGVLKPPLQAKSLITGRPYVYIAAGEKQPTKSAEADSLILLYDDEPTEGGAYQCVMADGHGQLLLVNKVHEQLRQRGK